MKGIKKIAIIVMAAVLMVSQAAFTGCKEGDPQDSRGALEFWSVSSLVKVYRDEYERYDSVRGDAAVSIEACRGEYESAQIIMTAKGRVNAYTVEYTDLTSADKEVISKDNIAVFHEKYIQVMTNYENTGEPAGMYPDALVPVENIVMAKENFIEDGHNQGLYFRVFVPIGQEPGIYTGTMTVHYDGERKDIPVRVEVFDLTVSEVTHMKSIYLNTWNFQSGELDSTQEMLNKYNEALAEYRLSVSNLMQYNNNTDSDIAYYTELAYEYMQNPNVTNVCIPVGSSVVDGQYTLDPEVFCAYVRSFAEKSFETGYNMFEKCTVYFIDEPQALKELERVKVTDRVYRETVARAATEVEAMASVDASFKEEVVESICNLHNIITSSYDPEWSPYIDTMCPILYHYNTADERKNYADEPERWWYTPADGSSYPSFDLEKSLVNLRLKNWMMANYGVVGDLYWATNFYARIVDDVTMPIEDYYAYAVRFPKSNGCGYLFYPGKQYGIDGPIGSMRLETTRDGIEEYEIFHALRNRYEQIAEKAGVEMNFEKIVSALTSTLYSGTQGFADSDAFYRARRMIISLAILANSDAGVCLLEADDNNDGTLEYTFLVEQGELEIDGEQVIDYTVSNEAKIYRVKFDLAEKGEFLISVGEEGCELTVGGKAEKYAGSRFETSVKDEEDDYAIAEVKGDSLQVTVYGEEEGRAFDLADDMFAALGGDTQKIVLEISLAQDAEPVELTLAAKYKNTAQYYALSTTELSPGKNRVVINVSTVQWSRVGGIEYLIFDMATDTDITLSIDSVCIYKK